MAASLLLLLVAGCAPTLTFTYEGTRFSTSGDAFSAQAEGNEKILASVDKLPAPTASKLRILVPDQPSIHDKGLRRTGTVHPELVSYVVSSTWRSFNLAVQLVEKRGLYQEVVTEESDGAPPARIEPGSDTLYMVIGQPPLVAGWHFASDRVPDAPIPLDARQSWPERMAFLLGRIEDLGRSR
jgi:hypothetical protein